MIDLSMLLKCARKFLSFYHRARVWRRDGRTDRQTDRQILIKKIPCICIRSRTVKKLKLPSQRNNNYNENRHQ